MKNEYAMVIAAALARAAMRIGKRDGAICFVAYEDDAGKLQFGTGFSEGVGHAFVGIDLADEERSVTASVITEWERESHGTLPWIDLVVLATMSSRGPNGITVASSTVPRSLLSDRYRAEARRVAHSEPMATQMMRAVEAASARQARNR